MAARAERYRRPLPKPGHFIPGLLVWSFLVRGLCVLVLVVIVILLFEETGEKALLLGIRLVL